MEPNKEFDYSLREIVNFAKDWRKQTYKEKPFFRQIFSRYKIKNVLEPKCFLGDRLASLIDSLDFAIGLETDYNLYLGAKEKLLSLPNIHIINSGIIEYNPQDERSFPERYDAILALDNQLPQYANLDNFAKYLKSAEKLLLPKGVLIIELFNYNKVLKDEFYNFSKIPLICNSEKYYMSRQMKIFDEDILKYLVDLYDISGHHVKSFTELHLILTKKRLFDWLKKSGFKVESFCGDYDMNDYNIDKSSKLILVASKL